MPLPTSLDPNDGDNIICFVAEITARRFLNRIHNSLYATEGTDFGQGVGKMLPISAELNRQLEAWYHAMPDNIRPPLTSKRRSSAGDAALDMGPIDISENDPQWRDTRQQHTTRTLSECVEILRIHYYAARHIIHRPFVLDVAWQYQQQILARDGTEFARNNDEKSKTTEATVGLQRSKSVAALASSSVPPLPLSADVLGNAQGLNIGFFRDEVAARLRQWATPGSSFEAELKIIESFPIRST
ncbi:hypothetical protein SPBR_06116 [Sporothrix brasiliensis 5110]|uniref:Uncharacterized protein n=1 Tax=Sporothrix brasiliensis 5110 TaxID=1398154 RepID=A0A0C2FTA5_9PEZI|nr:uncharacterized protein SPBR_06116 [Sporothrix brasiliensis 5110]KIH94248.1 hypothetical protein SPBR_06116 [Sporothrix brasiliensis 5110]